MSNIVPMTTREMIEEQAALWISVLDRGIEPKEKEGLDRWIKASEAHASALIESAEVWDAVGCVSILSGVFPLADIQHAERRSSFYWPRYAKVASIVFFVVTLSFVGQSDLLNEWWRAPFNSSFTTNYETAIGEHSTVSLPDATQIILNTDTFIEVQYTSEERKIVLGRGEAHFKVAHEPDRPLVVYVNNKRVKAVGTAFNVEIHDESSIGVLVTDGTVLVTEHAMPSYKDEVGIDVVLKEKSFFIKKGEKANVTKDAKSFVAIPVSDVEAEEELLWKVGKIMFRGDTLSAVIDEVNRYSVVKIGIAEDDLKSMRVAGLFQAGDVKGLLVTLEKSLGISYVYIDDNHVLLNKI